MKTQKFLYFTLAACLAFITGFLFYYCVEEAKHGRPSMIAGLLMISCFATTILLLIPSVWIIPGAAMFDGPDECYEWTDYLTYPFWFVACVILWLVSNAINLLAAIVFYSGGITFILAVAYSGHILNSKPENILAIVIGSVATTTIVAVLAWWGSCLGIRSKKGLTPIEIMQELEKNPVR